VEFDKDGCKVNDARGVVVAQARRDKNLYLLNVKVRKDMAHIANSLEESAMLWHERLGHLNMASLKELDAMVDAMNLKEVPLHHICEGCVNGKHQRTSFPQDRATTASNLFEIVHTDVCGPMRTTSKATKGMASGLVDCYQGGGVRHYCIFGGVPKYLKSIDM
jgi:hypothetical protein